MKLFCILIIICGLHSSLESQTINIHSISTSRQNRGDNGYTLDGKRMSSSREKLLNTSIFGPNGRCDKNVTIFDGYEKSGSLTELKLVSTDDIFFFGSFNQLDASTQDFTDAEIDSLYNWSVRGGKLIIASGIKYFNAFDATMLNSKWEYTWTQNAPSSIIPNTTGSTLDIFSGLFGSVTSANQGAAAQGHFTSIPDNSKIFATDKDGNPTLFMNCNTLDLIIADIDAYTDLGGISSGKFINNNQDRFWLNTIVFMDRLQTRPVITDNSGVLSLNSDYVNYQWFHDGSPISSDAILNTIEKGIYFVEVELNGGCKITSDSIIVSEISSDINLFPNPSNNFIKVSGLRQQESYRIYNVLGLEVKNGILSNLEEIDLSGIVAGIYFLQIDDTSAIKFLKQ